MKVMSLILSLVLLLGCLSGCVPVATTFSTGDVEFVEESQATDPYFPGQLTFTPQRDRALTVTYTGQAVSLTVYEADGEGSWTLSLPEGALSGEEGVEISALPIVDGSFSGGGGLFTGVQLEPQGLSFVKPLTLTYRGEAGDFPLVLLSDSEGEVWSC